MSIAARLRAAEKKLGILQWRRQVQAQKRAEVKKSGPPPLPPAPTTDEELGAAIQELTGFRVPDVRVCDDHVAPLKALGDAYFGRHPVTVWHGSRGLAGKSTLLALLCFAETVFLGAQVTILGGSEEQSKRVQEAQIEAWEHEKAPVHLLAATVTPTRTKLVNKGWSRALTASTKSARGPHPQRLRLDEADEMKQFILDSALGQPMEARGIQEQTVISSTHHYADGTFTEVLDRAEEKGWPVHKWCYRESMVEGSGWLTEAQKERKRSVIPKAMWDIEYELGEPSPESRAIMPESVEQMFKKKLGDYKGAPKERIWIEPKKARKQGVYVSGADWAKEQDWTVLTSLRVDVKPIRLVAYQRMRRMPWPAMVRKFDEQVRAYPGKAAHDGTGLGDVVDDLIMVQAEGVTLVGRRRDDILSEYIAAIEKGQIVSPMIKHSYKAHKDASLADVYGSAKNHHCPDPIISGALAWYAYKHGRTSWEKRY